jgi:hypothetical protein
LAKKAPCDPRTLTRAARDEAAKHPEFAVEAGIAALRWLCEGYGYEITSADIRDAYRYAMEAAKNANSSRETAARIRKLIASQTSGDRLVARVLSKELEPRQNE